MSRFYMTMTGGKSNSEKVTRRHYSGGNVVAASFHGAIRVVPYVGENNVDCVRVTRENWHVSNGPMVILYDGPFYVMPGAIGDYKTDLKTQGE
jgi:hypothetical protein